MVKITHKFDEAMLLIVLLVLFTFLRFAPEIFYKITLLALLHLLTLVSFMAFRNLKRKVDIDAASLLITIIGAQFLAPAVWRGIDRVPFKQSLAPMILMMLGVMLWYSKNIFKAEE